MKYSITLLILSLVTQFSVKGQSQILEKYSHYNLIADSNKGLNDSLLDDGPFNQFTFSAYSVSKLWNEDTCGKKDYRRNIVVFLDSQVDKLKYKPKDIFRLLGEPYHITNSTQLTIYQYIVKKDNECLNISDIATFFYDKEEIVLISITHKSTSPVVEEDLR